MASSAKKAPATKAAATAPAKKAPAKKAAAPAKKAPAKAPATKAPAKKAPAPAKQAPAPAKQAPAKAPATKAPAKAPATKAPAKKAPAKKAPAKAPATKAPAKAPAKKAPAKAPAKKAPAKRTAQAFDAAFIKQQRAALESEKLRYLRQAEYLRDEADSLMNEREPGDVQFDEESGEGDTIAVERERDLALSAQARAAVEEIERALARIEAGTYGICVVSGEPIPRERLEAIPWAAERVEYKVGGFGRR